MQANIYSDLLTNGSYEDANAHNSFYLDPVFVPFAYRIDAEDISPLAKLHISSCEYKQKNR